MSDIPPKVMGDAMKCFICERGPSHGISVFRINPKGQKGIWACEVHRPAGSQHIGAEARKIVQIIEDSENT